MSLPTQIKRSLQKALSILYLDSAGLNAMARMIDDQALRQSLPGPTTAFTEQFVVILTWLDNADSGARLQAVADQVRYDADDRVKGTGQKIASDVDGFLEQARQYLEQLARGDKPMLEGIQTISDSLARPTVRQVMLATRDSQRQILDHFTYLSEHKALHDFCHQIQDKQIKRMKINLSHMAELTGSSDAARNAAPLARARLGFAREVANIKSQIASLDQFTAQQTTVCDFAASLRKILTTWVDSTASFTPDASWAANDAEMLVDDLMADLDHEMTGLDALMNQRTRDGDAGCAILMRQLVERLSRELMTLQDLSADERATMEKAIASFKSLAQRLDELIMQHHQLQGIVVRSSRLENRIAYAGGSQNKQGWERVKNEMLPDASETSADVLYVKLRPAIDDVDAALGQSDSSNILAAYQQFLDGLRDTFFDVDTDLKRECDRLPALAGEWSQLLQRVNP